MQFPLTPLEHLHRQMTLEGIRLDENQTLTCLRDDGEPPPLCIAARTVDGQTVLYFKAGLPVELHRELFAAANELRFPDISGFASVFGAYGIAARTGHYQTYIFPPSYAQAQTPLVERLPSHDPRVQEFGFGGFGRAVYAIVREGTIRSACVSSRQNETCAEAWVLTALAQRGKGLARQVVTAWARDLINAGLTPFYSHKVQNLASARLAAALQLAPVFEEIVLEGDR